MTFIKGEHCELRVLEDGDAEIFTKAVNQGLTTQHLFTGSIPMRTADYKARWEGERKAGDILFGIWFSPLAKHVDSPVEYPWQFIGTAGLHSHRDIYKSWEVRFLIFDPDCVGKGIGGEVVRAIADYGFRRLNAHRLWLGVSEHNLRAVKCYLDCGFVFEGRERDSIFYNGKYHAAIRMSLLESEWRAIAQSSVDKEHREEI